MISLARHGTRKGVFAMEKNQLVKTPAIEQGMENARKNGGEENAKAYLDCMSSWDKERRETFKNMKLAWKNKKNGELYEDRNDYLRSLPKDKNGTPILDDEAKDTFEELASEFDWDVQFVDDYVIGNGLVCAWDFEEYYKITD